MERKQKIVVACSVFAAICFAIVSYGHFCRGRTSLGCLFATLALAQVLLAIINYKNYKKT